VLLLTSLLLVCVTDLTKILFVLQVQEHISGFSFNALAFRYSKSVTC
jgi:hypothetical protein